MLWGLQQLQVTIIVKKRQKDTFDPMLDWPGGFFSGLVMPKRCTDRYTRKERCMTIQIIPWMRSVTTLKPLCMWWWYSVHILWMRNFWKFTGLLVVGLHHGLWLRNFAFLREVGRIWNRIESKYMYGLRARERGRRSEAGILILKFHKNTTHSTLIKTTK